MNRYKLFLFLSLACFAFYTQAQPATKAKPKLKTKKTPSGLEYQIFKPNKGPKIAAGDLVFFKFKGTASDSTLYNSYTSAEAPYISFQVKENFPKGNFEEALTLVGAGDSAVFLLNIDTFFNTYVGKPAPSFVKKGDPLYLYVKVDSFVTKKVIEERKVLTELRMKDKQKNEVSSIDEYIKNSGLLFTRTPSGLYYVITETTNGAKASPGDKVGAIYTGKLFDGKVFDSNKHSGSPFEFQLGAHQVIAGWDEIFSILKVGEKATIVLPSFLAYGERGAGKDIEPFTPLVFDVEFINITKAEKAKSESESMDEYIKTSGLKFTRTPSGLFYIITETTNGAKASKGDKVGAIYTGKLLNGKVFDSNKASGRPFEFELGAHQVIAGWDEIFSILKEGEKATIILPSTLAYGANGAGHDIGPNTPLIFDVEFIKITKAGN